MTADDIKMYKAAIDQFEQDVFREHALSLNRLQDKRDQDVAMIHGARRTLEKLKKEVTS